VIKTDFFFGSNAFDFKIKTGYEPGDPYWEITKDVLNDSIFVRTSAA
jgi:hypothetical protein